MDGGYKHHARSKPPAPWRIGLLLALALATAAPARAAAVAADGEGFAVSDGETFHVHAAGEPFAVTLTWRGGARALEVQWQDYRGRRLAPAVTLRAAGEYRLAAPPSRGGYLQLAVSGTATGGHAARVFGFARLVPQDVATNPGRNSRFGIVHGDPADPHTAAWNKTLTWQTLHPDAWAQRMRADEREGRHELPLIVGHEWDSDDSVPIGTAQLAALEARAARYFAASPAGSVWELGLEENLSPRHRQPHYWQNLRKKAEALRAVANRIDPSIRFVYQVATTTADDVRHFLESEAAAYFDILALHPYAWPDFADPTHWLEDLLHGVRAHMKRTGRRLPIWFTEVGVPTRGQTPAPRFRTADTHRPVTGLDRAEAVSYLIKLHAIAFHAGVERIFWYHYQDRGATGDDPEDYFGLRDQAGFPKPSFVAHHLLRRQLDGKLPARLLKPAPGARFYEFTDGTQRTLIGWGTRGTATIPLSAISTEHHPSDAIEATNGVGDPLPLIGSQIHLTSEPLILTIRAQRP